MQYTDEFNKLIQNFYEIERMICSLEKEPKTYNTDQLLYFNEVHTLGKIAQNEGISQKELSHAMYRTKGATSVIINKLLQKGLIEKSSGKGDMRKHALYLSEKGKKVHESHMQYDSSKLSALVENISLTDEQVTTANEVISACLNAFRETIYKE